MLRTYTLGRRASLLGMGGRGSKETHQFHKLMLVHMAILIHIKHSKGHLFVQHIAIRKEEKGKEGEGE